MATRRQSLIGVEALEPVLCDGAGDKLSVCVESGFDSSNDEEARSISLLETIPYSSSE